MCKDYGLKEWCGLESRAIRSLLKSDQNHRIMLLSLDGGTIDGILDIDGYLNISNETNDEVADAIFKRLQDLNRPSPLTQSFYPPLLSQSPMINTSAIIQTFKNVISSITLWHIVIASLSYLLGTLSRR